MNRFYKTIVISDVHLGYKRSKVKQACNFLSGVECRRLILNGDIFDGWRIRKKSMNWRPEYTEFVKIILDKMENKGTDVIYLGGNHDAFINKLIPLNFRNFDLLKECIIESGEHKFFVTHGDIFDRICTNLVWLSKIGDLSYRTLAFLNRWYDKWRDWRKKPRYSFSTKIRRRVKEILSSSKIYDTMSDIAKAHGCDGLIFGHTHRPDDRMIGDIRFLNSGDWIETMSALLETEEGVWELLKYDETDGLMKPVRN